MNNLTWDKYFLNIADEVSKKSHCLSRNLGCIIVNNRRILSTGYNGPPSGIMHCEWRNDRGEWAKLKTLNDFIHSVYKPKFECPRQRMGYKSGEGLEYCSATHAEANAIVFAARNGVKIDNSAIYINSQIMPCRECAKLIINAGIKEVILKGEPVIYKQVGITGYDLLIEAGVIIRDGSK